MAARLNSIRLFFFFSSRARAAFVACDAVLIDRIARADTFIDGPICIAHGPHPNKQQHRIPAALSSIPSNAPRTAAVMIFIDIVWLSLGVVWLLKFYIQTDLGEAKEIMLGKSIAMLSV